MDELRCQADAFASPKLRRAVEDVIGLAQTEVQEFESLVEPEALEEIGNRVGTFTCLLSILCA